MTERDIADWVSEAADPVDVIIQMDRGRPSGRADCVFSSDREARRVASNMHRRDLGSRWVGWSWSSVLIFSLAGTLNASMREQIDAFGDIMS